MSEPKDKTIALNVRLKPSEPSAHPLATNYTNVGVAPGIAYVDFGSSSPRCSEPLRRRRKMVKPPKGLEGHLVTRVAMGWITGALASADPASTGYHAIWAAAEAEYLSLQRSRL